MNVLVVILDGATAVVTFSSFTERAFTDAVKADIVEYYNVGAFMCVYVCVWCG